MFGRLFNGIANGARKVWGIVREPLRRLGSFALDNHQPLAVLTNAITSQSDNPYVRALGSGAVMGSALLSQKGFGKNYFNVPPPSMSGT